MYYDQFNTGKRIQKLRRERYLTQEELAVRMNVSDRHLQSWEWGVYSFYWPFHRDCCIFWCNTGSFDYGKVVIWPRRKLTKQVAAKAFDKSKASFEIAAYYAETVCNRWRTLTLYKIAPLRASSIALLVQRGAFCFCTPKNFFEKFRFYRIFCKSEISTQRCFYIKTGSITSGFSSQKTGGTTS